jgi:hypothetical protein
MEADLSLLRGASTAMDDDKSQIRLYHHPAGNASGIASHPILVLCIEWSSCGKHYALAVAEMMFHSSSSM